MTGPTPRMLAGRYALKTRLGGGGYGDVYLARDLTLERDVALKIFKDDIVREGDPVWLEARAAARISSPFVATLHDIVQDGECVFLVYEFVAGLSLETVLRSRRLTLPECRRILSEVCQGVGSAHAVNLLHRDLKPGNMVLTSDPIDESRNVVIKVTDFGLAKLRDQATQITARHLGTPAYMSPEQFIGAPSAPQTDVYALGVVAYKMLTGSLPFASGDMRHRHMHEPAPALDNYSRRLTAVIQKAMAKAMDERFPSVNEFRSALEQAMDAEHGPAPTILTTAPITTPRPAAPPPLDTQAVRAYLDGVATKLRGLPAIDGFQIDPNLEPANPTRAFGSVRLWEISRSFLSGGGQLVVAAISLGRDTGLGPDGFPREDILDQIEDQANGIVTFARQRQHRIGIFSPNGWPDTWTQYPLSNPRTRFYLVDKPKRDVAAWRVVSGAPDDPLRRLFDPETKEAATRRIRAALEEERRLRRIGEDMPLAEFADAWVADPQVVAAVIAEWGERFKIVNGDTIQRRKDR